MPGDLTDKRISMGAAVGYVGIGIATYLASVYPDVTLLTLAGVVAFSVVAIPGAYASYVVTFALIQQWLDTYVDPYEGRDAR